MTGNGSTSSPKSPKSTDSVRDRNKQTILLKGKYMLYFTLYSVITHDFPRPRCKVCRESNGEKAAKSLEGRRSL